MTTEKTGSAENRELHLLEKSRLKKVLRHVMADEPVNEEELEAAQDTVRIIIQQAEKHGLTEAETLKALLSPLFSAQQWCECMTCQARRGGHS